MLTLLLNTSSVDIHSSLLSLTNENEKITWSAFIKKIHQVILNKYAGEDMASYKSKWKHRFKTAAQRLELSVESHHLGEEDLWKE